MGEEEGGGFKKEKEALRSQDEGIHRVVTEDTDRSAVVRGKP